MVSHLNPPAELYNLRWNSYFSNLMTMVVDHQDQEALVDVTLTCEGQFIKAHKLILSACSVYFQKMFEVHTVSPLLVVLNNVKFKDLQLVIQFMYKGEVKVADSGMQDFLSVAKMLQVKGLCAVELQDKQKQSTDQVTLAGEKQTNVESVPAQLPKPSINKENDCPMEIPVTIPKKRKLVMPPSEENTREAKNVKTTHPPDPIPYIPRPPNAFMIFANQWRKKLAVEYPGDSKKDISVRLGNMWKSLAKETKESFYEEARKAEEEYKAKCVGYVCGPKESNNRQAATVAGKGPQTVNSIVHVDIKDFHDNECVSLL